MVNLLYLNRVTRIHLIFFEACVWDPKWDGPKWIEGEVMVSRSPTVHPGDAQQAMAIGKPPDDMVNQYAVENLFNVLVFSVKGKCLHSLVEALF
jgi:hypothetical protein